MNDRIALKKMLAFIKETTWNSLGDNVKNQAVKMFLDLAGVICAGAKNNSAKRAAEYVSRNYPSGRCTVLTTGQKVNLIGAALSNGMSANALDMDDGYSLLRGHPGSGFFGALISATEECNCSYGDVLAALVVAYELSIRQGYAIRDYYKWDHSSGCYSAFATAACVGKLLGLSDKEMENALGIADFIAPLNPAKRSCYVPSMNKDGIYYGQHTGTQAVMMAKTGITGCNPVILDENYIKYIDTLGEKYYIFDLYIKFYSCCRWAHSPIRAISNLMKEKDIILDQIENINIYSFGNAGTLYKLPPKCEDEAQYNIVYPIAAQLLFGDCGPLESSTTKMLDPQIPPLMEKIQFLRDPVYDRLFPAKRFSRVELRMKNGEIIVSEPCEPQGDKNAAVSLKDIEEKIRKINGRYASSEMIDRLIDIVCNTPFDASFANVFSVIKTLAKTNLNSDIVFI